jgi:hypothetical protein
VVAFIETTTDARLRMQLPSAFRSLEPLQNAIRSLNPHLLDLPADDEAPLPVEDQQALASMRTAEAELRSRLRFLQIMWRSLGAKSV